MSELVETALRLLLQSRSASVDLRPLPSFDSGGALLMREHGIRRICTRDTDFHRFPFVEPVDPLTEHQR